MPNSTDVWGVRADSWRMVCSTPPFLQFRSAILEAARPDPHKVLLDLGAGTGLVALAAAERCGEVHAVDSSPKMVEILSDEARRRRLGNVHAVEADMRRLPIGDQSVDIVTSCYALHHLSDDGKELVAAEAMRVLRPGGRLVIVDMMFRLSFARRDRQIVASKVLMLARKGPSGLLRIARNGGRVLAGRWEQPAPLEWWREMLAGRGFDAVQLRPLVHEAGIAYAERPQVQ